MVKCAQSWIFLRSNVGVFALKCRTNALKRRATTQGVVWILKNSKDLLDYIQSRPLSSCNNIKTFDFSTLYTAIPHSKLKERLRELIQLCFIKRNGQCRYKYLVLVRDRSYFVKKTKHSDSTKKFSETDIINILEFLIYNIFVMSGGRLFQQTSGIPYKLLLFSPTFSFIRLRLTSYTLYLVIKKNKTKLARSFNWFHQIFSKWQVVGLSHFVRPPGYRYMVCPAVSVLELQL